ncbi:MAG: sugar phosphate nucleotidyltransferase [Candidatus Zipacnadales bacterium]
MSRIQPIDILCVIPGAGQATRMRPLSYTRPKQLLPIANRPIIDYILGAVYEAGLRRVCLITNPAAYELQSYVRRTAPADLTVTYVEQKRALGIADAVKQVVRDIENNPTVIYLGDALYSEGIGEFVRLFCKHYPRGLMRTKLVEQPAEYGTLGFDQEGRIYDVREKDPHTPYRHAITGLYGFPRSFHRAFDPLRLGVGDEFQITDVIARFLRAEGDEWGPEWDGVYAEVYTGQWLDAGRPSVFLAANAHYLRKRLDAPEAGDPAPLEYGRGRAMLGQGSEMLGGIEVIGDVLVGRGCQLYNARLIGPCAINDGAVIRNSTIENSIIDAEAVIEGMRGGVTESIIGIGAHLSGDGQQSALSRAVVGDGDRVYYY